MLKNFLKFMIMKRIHFKLVLLHINDLINKGHPVLFISWNISIINFNIIRSQPSDFLDSSLEEDTLEISTSYWLSVTLHHSKKASQHILFASSDDLDKAEEPSGKKSPNMVLVTDGLYQIAMSLSG